MRVRSVVTVILAIVIVCCAGGVVAFAGSAIAGAVSSAVQVQDGSQVSTADASTEGSDSTEDVSTADGDAEAGEEEEEEQDPREADLALDTSAETEWSYEESDEKVVYLTFDDGPSENTEAILDILDEYDAKATFFVTGLNPNYYDLIGEAYSRGHSIGLHTMSHSYSTVYASVDAYFEDLEQIGKIVEEQIGFVPFLVRFPGGSSNTVSAKYCSGIMTALTQELIARGYQYYDWNADSGDANGNNIDAETLVSTASFHGDHNNVIILMHDTAAKDTTVEALPRIIEYYREQGYTFAAISRSSYVSHHTVNN